MFQISTHDCMKCHYGGEKKKFCSVVTIHVLYFNVGVSSIRQCLRVKHFVYSGYG